MKFRAGRAGTITALKFYKGPQNTGQHSARLWTTGGQRLAQVTFTNETASGWQTATLPVPVPIAANTTYIVSYHAPNGRYSVNNGFFRNASITAGDLTGLRDVSGNGNGVYQYGAAGGFPRNTYQASNYWVDVVFVPGTGATSTAPTISTQPTDRTVSLGATATFSVVASGTGTLTYQWQKNGANISGATAASYTTPATTIGDSGATFRVVVSNSGGGTTSNNASLTVSRIATATVLTSSQTTKVASGTSVTLLAKVSTSRSAVSWSGEVEFLQGSTLLGRKTVHASGQAEHTWTAPGTGGVVQLSARYLGTSTMEASNATALEVEVAGSSSELQTAPLLSLWSDTTAVDGVVQQDGSRLVVGVKFRSSSKGLIRGLKYFRPVSAKGTRIGKLWTRNGQLLGTTTFSGDSSSGWQSAQFSTPIEIQAHTTYVASYDVPDGTYVSSNGAFFSNGVTADPLVALKDGTDGGNGVYVYGNTATFPNQTYQSSDYWVDVLLDTTSTRGTGAPSITTAPSSHSVTAGTEVTFTAAASGTAPLKYQWRRNGVNIAGATGSSLQLTASMTQNQSRYSVVVSNSAGYVESTAAFLRVSGDGSSTTLSLSPQQITPGASTQITVQVKRNSGAVLSAGSKAEILLGGKVWSLVDLDSTGKASVSFPASAAGVYVVQARYPGTEAVEASASTGAELYVWKQLPAGGRPISDAEAARFLGQATFGARKADVDQLMTIGYEEWFQEQFSKKTRSYSDYQQGVAPITDNQNTHVTAFYTQAVRDEDQLRQRLAYTLSQIFVVSGVDGRIGLSPYGDLMDYADLLKSNSFGTYRNLLERVTRARMMSLMLTYLGNSENLEEGILPDQNFAREILQLFSIGLYELNLDGSLKLTHAQPKETYSLADIMGLAKVFTGFHEVRDAYNNVKPEVEFSYPDNRSRTAKSFLGVTLPASGWRDANEELRVALDTIANHPNVGPFISKQLIQKHTTSNPSPAYIERVARVFNNNGNGVRGDLKAVIRAVLMDPEARDRSKLEDPNWGKVREPLLRAVQYMRLLDTKASDGFVYDGTRNCYYVQYVMADVAERPYHAPSVFNFYRPGYAPPGSNLDQANLVAPELQIVDTVSIFEWSKYVMDTLVRGGTGGGGHCVLRNQFHYSPWLPLANDPKALVDRLNVLLFGGSLTTEAYGQILRAVEGAKAGDAKSPLALNRVRTAFAIALLHPHFMVQR